MVEVEGVAPGLAGAVAASPAVWAGDTLYLSGLSGVTPGDSADLDAQVHEVGRRQTAVLDAAGLDLDSIASGFVYLQDMEDYQPMNAIYREYFSRGPGGDVRVFASFIAARTR